MEKTYDRSVQDIGNILGMEHLNVQVPNQEMAQTFYAAGLGFTRDPYMMVGPENMWINVGQQQFHLPTRDPQVFPGYIGVVVPRSHEDAPGCHQGTSRRDEIYLCAT